MSFSSHSRKGRGRSGGRPQEPTYRRVTTLSDSEDEAGDYALLRETVANHSGSTHASQDPRYVDRQQVSRFMNGQMAKKISLYIRRPCYTKTKKIYGIYKCHS